MSGNLAVSTINGVDISVSPVLNDTQLRSRLNATGTAPIYACRAWVNFNGTGTVAISESKNVSSITDVGVDDYRINFSSAMPSANYAIGGAASNIAITTNNVTQARAASINGESPTTTTCRISYGGNGTNDKQMCTFFIVG